MRSRISRLLPLAITVLLATSGNLFAQADLSLTLSGGPDGSGCGGAGGCGGVIPITPGGRAAFYVQLNNMGPAPASNVVVTVTFPPGTSIGNFGPPGQEICTVSTVNSQPTLTCTQSALTSGGSFAVVISLNIAPDYPWRNPLIATALARSDTADPILANNTAVVTLAVTPPSMIPTLRPPYLALLIFILALIGVSVLSRVA